MAADSNAVEQAVSRTLRDNLEKIQRTADELHQAVNDMVSACASSRPSNALPSMLRAQTSAASLSATLEVLSRFVTSALQPAMRGALETEGLRVPSMGAGPVPQTEQPPPPPSHPMQKSSWAPPKADSPMPGIPKMPKPAQPSRIAEAPPAIEMPLAAEPAAPLRSGLATDFVPVPEFLPDLGSDAEQVLLMDAEVESEPAVAGPIFSLDSLPPEAQELHRRAWRVAKVSMQDIKMLRPEEVRLGRQNKDLCFRLRDEIEKAHKEYDRRFQAIQSHPVDYFYDWMVEILAGGDPQALGQYPYPSPVLRR